MGRHVKRQTPRRMPTAEQINQMIDGIPKPFMVVGSRAARTQDNRTARFDIHGRFRFATGGFEDFADKHAVLFVHGYNVTADEGLTSAREFFQLLHAALVDDQIPVDECTFVLFTWPGDTGTVHFNDAQQYAQHSGVALFELLRQTRPHAPRSISVVTHSLGAHVALRAFSILGERRFRQKVDFRVERALLLGAAVEDDVFERPERSEEYHFPEAAFGLRHLHIVISRDDDVLGAAFHVNEFDWALGHSGPETMEPLVSLARRVEAVLGENEKFLFELHDFTSSSATIMDPDLHVHSHGGYWRSRKQLKYYVNLLKHEGQF